MHCSHCGAEMRIIGRAPSGYPRWKCPNNTTPENHKRAIEKRNQHFVQKKPEHGTYPSWAE